MNSLIGSTRPADFWVRFTFGTTIVISDYLLSPRRYARELSAKYEELEMTKSKTFLSWNDEIVEWVKKPLIILVDKPGAVQQSLVKCDLKFFLNLSKEEM